MTVHRDWTLPLDVDGKDSQSEIQRLEWVWISRRMPTMSLGVRRVVNGSRMIEKNSVMRRAISYDLDIHSLSRVRAWMPRIPRREKRWIVSLKRPVSEVDLLRPTKGLALMVRSRPVWTRRDQAANRICAARHRGCWVEKKSKKIRRTRAQEHRSTARAPGGTGEKPSWSSELESFDLTSPHVQGKNEDWTMPGTDGKLCKSSG